MTSPVQMRTQNNTTGKTSPFRTSYLLPTPPHFSSSRNNLVPHFQRLLRPCQVQRREFIVHESTVVGAHSITSSPRSVLLPMILYMKVFKQYTNYD